MLLNIQLTFYIFMYMSKFALYGSTYVLLFSYLLSEYLKLAIIKSLK